MNPPRPAPEQPLLDYLDRIPTDATPQDIALQRTLLTPWMRPMMPGHGT